LISNRESGLGNSEQAVGDGDPAASGGLFSDLASEVLEPCPSAGDASGKMIETLSTKSHQGPQCIPAATMESSRADNFRHVLPAGIVFQASIDGPETVEDNCAEALGLAQRQIPLRLAPLETLDGAQCLLSASVRRALEQLTLQRVDLTRSVLYQAGPAASWTLDFHGHSRVGRTSFCTDRIPDGWAERCNAMDEVWVPSHFHRQTFVAAGVQSEKLRVMRTGVDTGLFCPGVQPLDVPHARAFNFLSVSQTGRQWGTDVLLRAYVREFKPDEDVALLLRILGVRDSSADSEARLTFFIETELGAALEQTPTIVLLDAPLSHTDRARLYASANAFVFPSRGESWGRACLEALASGLPVIATQWGGASEFLHDANSYPIAVEEIVPASCEDEFVAGHRWAEPSVDDLRRQMREVFTDSREAQKRAAQGRCDAVEHWDWSIVIPAWAQEFRRLCD
jgi:glycosyltransferase involved in cell wall biosynthesis